MALQSVTVLPSAARTAAPSAVDIDVADDVEVAELLVNTTAIGAAPSTTVIIQFPDDAGNYVTILATPAITAVGTVRLLIGLGVVGAANSAAPAVLPKRIRILFQHGNANSHTYSVAYRAR